MDVYLHRNLQLSEILSSNRRLQDRSVLSQNHSLGVKSKAHLPGTSHNCCSNHNEKDSDPMMQMKLPLQHSDCQNASEHNHGSPEHLIHTCIPTESLQVVRTSYWPSLRCLVVKYLSQDEGGIPFRSVAQCTGMQCLQGSQGMSTFHISHHVTLPFGNNNRPSCNRKQQWSLHLKVADALLYLASASSICCWVLLQSKNCQNRVCVLQDLKARSENAWLKLNMRFHF